MSDIVIVSAARTPIGRLAGSLSSLPAHQLGRTAIVAALERAGIAPGEVSEVIMGQVLTAGVGQNPARQAAIAAGIPVEITSMTINQVCGSGLRAVALACQSLQTGDSSIVVAGGQESMSQTPHCTYLRTGTKFGDTTLIDTMLRDGLWDIFEDYHMGITAENVAKKYDISREQQDEFALASQQKAAAAQAAGFFRKEIAPVKIAGRKGETIVELDEAIRSDTSKEALAALRPSFSKAEGTVTAGNASGINDGAAALVLMREEEASRRGLTPLGRIASWATTGVEPAFMGMGPVSATRKALSKVGWQLGEVDLIEAGEAFAAQSCAVAKELAWDQSRVNVNGGAIALGHPIGASGARILTTLLHELERRDTKRGLATLCIGGGMGIALCVER